MDTVHRADRGWSRQDCGFGSNTCYIKLMSGGWLLRFDCVVVTQKSSVCVWTISQGVLGLSKQHTGLPPLNVFYSRNFVGGSGSVSSLSGMFWLHVTQQSHQWNWNVKWKQRLCCVFEQQSLLILIIPQATPHLDSLELNYHTALFRNHESRTTRSPIRV